MTMRRLPLLLMVFFFSGCAVLPGGSVPLDRDAPTTHWTESTFLDVYGTPNWTARGPDGQKVMYYKYKSAPDSKALAVATAITTFGLVTDAGSLDLQAIGVVDADGKFVCADRVNINYEETVRCPHEMRLKIREGLSGPQRDTYQAMLKRINKEAYVPGHYRVVNETVLTPTEVEAALQRGRTDAVVADPEYYSNGECSLLTRWYAKHVAAMGLDPSAANAAARRYDARLYEAGGSRGLNQAAVDDDVSLYSAALQYQIDSPWIENAERYARDCIQARARADRVYSFRNIDDLIHRRVKERMDLARNLLLIDQPESASKPDDVYFYGFLSISKARQFGVTDDALLAQKAALGEAVTISSLAEPIQMTELVLTRLIEQGDVPSRELVKSLIRAMDARIAIGDHDATIQIMANIGRYYLAHIEDKNAMSWGIDALINAAQMADYRGDFDTSSSLALLAGEMALKDIELTLAADGLDTERARDTVRETLSFVPYSYTRTSWDGVVTRYEVNAPAFDAQGMLNLINTLKSKHYKASTALAYAASFQLPPEPAGRFFASMAVQANEGFSSGGASRYYSLAGTAYEQAGQPLTAAQYKFYSSINNVASVSDKARSQRLACEGGYASYRRQFDEQFNDPDTNQVAELFGQEMADAMRKYDRICKFK